MDVIRCTTSELDDLRLRQIRGLMDDAFDGAFEPADWDHAVGGVHLVGEVGGEIVTHASVVPRTLWLRDRPLRCGYVEAVATAGAHRRRGWASTLLRAAAEVIATSYELGGLSANDPAFYAGLGWEAWRGPTHVARAGVWVRTPDDDDAFMVLRNPGSPEIDLTAAIACEDRPGDPW